MIPVQVCEGIGVGALEDSSKPSKVPPALLDDDRPPTADAVQAWQDEDSATIAIAAS